MQFVPLLYLRGSFSQKQDCVESLSQIATHIRDKFTPHV